MSDTNAVVETSAPVATGLREFVVGRVGDIHVAVPADRVEATVAAVRGSEPPCDEPWVAGWFTHRDRLWLSVRLDGRAADCGPVGKRLVMRESTGVRYAIELDEVYGPVVLDAVANVPYPAERWAAPTEWLKVGFAHDGRPICCVDVDEVTKSVVAG
jgi:hypothetical protein